MQSATIATSQNNHFDIFNTPLQGLHVIQRKPMGDTRGYLERLFCIKDFEELLPNGKSISQINHTLTILAGTVRGMHFQSPPHTEMKFVHCIRGEVFDVAVDLRKDSPTFLCWHAEILSDTNHKTLVIPEGFAHGFQSLTHHCEMLYFHTNSYCQNAEQGLDALDLELAIRWPLTISHRSKRDMFHPKLTINFQGIIL